MKHLLISVVSLFHHHHNHQPEPVIKPVALVVAKPSLDVGLLDRAIVTLPKSNENETKVICIYPVSAAK